MNVPADREIFRTEIAEFWFDEGILCCNAKPVKRSISNLTLSFKLVERITGGKKVCLLADLSTVDVDAESERDFAMAMLPRYYKAMALVSQTGFVRAIANMFLRIYCLPVPVKVFKNEAKAREWLKSYLSAGAGL